MLAALALVSLFVDAPPSAAPELRKLGIDCVYVAPEAVAAWTTAGACAKALPATVKLAVPGVQYRMNRASASNAPWVDTNGAQYVRGLKATALVEGNALAAAEAAAYQTPAIVKAAQKDWPAYAEMTRFLATIPESKLPLLANIGFLDDGTPAAAENINLFIRRNLLFRLVTAPDSKLDITVKPNAGDPSAYAYEVRQKLGDEKRLLRLYGSDVVIARLQGDAKSRRLTLLNYSPRKVEGVRIKLAGSYPNIKVYAFGETVTPAELTTADGATEFSLPLVPTYMVIDLQH